MRRSALALLSLAACAPAALAAPRPSLAASRAPPASCDGTVWCGASNKCDVSFDVYFPDPTGATKQAAGRFLIDVGGGRVRADQWDAAGTSNITTILSCATEAAAAAGAFPSVACVESQVDWLGKTCMQGPNPGGVMAWGLPGGTRVPADAGVAPGLDVYRFGSQGVGPVDFHVHPATCKPATQMAWMLSYFPPALTFVGGSQYTKFDDQATHVSPKDFDPKALGAPECSSEKAVGWGGLGAPGFEPWQGAARHAKGRQ